MFIKYQKDAPYNIVSTSSSSLTGDSSHDVAEIGYKLESIVDEFNTFIYKFINNEVVPYTEIELLKINSIKELGYLCTNFINSTFTSSALGEPHLYSYDEEARENLKTSMLAMPYFPEGATIEWRIHDTRELIDHNKDQITQLYLDSVNHVEYNVGEYRNYESQVNAASTENEINGVMVNARNYFVL